MATVTIFTMAIGVLMSALGGLLYEHGSDSLYGTLNWVPSIDWLFANPGTTFVFGIVLILASLACQPRRIH